MDEFENNFKYEVFLNCIMTNYFYRINTKNMVIIPI